MDHPQIETTAISRYVDSRISADVRDLLATKSSNKAKRARTFTRVAASTWNSLPLTLRYYGSFESFRKHFKTHTHTYTYTYTHTHKHTHTHTHRTFCLLSGYLLAPLRTVAYNYYYYIWGGVNYTYASFTFSLTMYLNLNSFHF